MDARVLEQILWHIHNWFERDSIQVTGCTVSGGRLPASIPDGAWYRIEGSLMNDGLHRHPDAGLYDETFDGTITICAIPNAVLDLAEEVGEWMSRYDAASKEALSRPYQSESFGGYTYSLRSDLTGGGSSGWQDVFSDRLNDWRKVC